MDGHNNHIPAEVRRVHLIAVCGTAMGALACMLKDLGYEVTGSDQKVYPPMSRFLADRAIPVMDGYRAEHLADRPDLVVVGNGVPRTNPEALACEPLGLPYCSMPQAVNRFVADGKQTLMVAGTHGKTTTAALLACPVPFFFRVLERSSQKGRSCGQIIVLRHLAMVFVSDISTLNTGSVSILLFLIGQNRRSDMSSTEEIFEVLDTDRRGNRSCYPVSSA